MDDVRSMPDSEIFLKKLRGKRVENANNIEDFGSDQWVLPFIIK